MNEKREYKIKPIEDLEFTDDFMFGAIMQDEVICKGVLERLLQKTITKIEYPKLQNEIAPFYEAKGVRFDVYVDDGKTVYDVELQNKKLDCIEKRVRYYQSMIDIDALSRGADYSELKESFIIFICKTDPFDSKCPKYEVESKLKGTTFEINKKTREKTERPISRVYDDGTRKIFFNSSAYEYEADAKIKAFLHFVNKAEPTDDFTTMLKEKVMETKKQDKFRNDYMAWGLAFRDVRKEGEHDNAVSAAKNLLLMHLLTFEQISQAQNLPLSEVQALAKEMGIS